MALARYIRRRLKLLLLCGISLSIVVMIILSLRDTHADEEIVRSHQSHNHDQVNYKQVKFSTNLLVVVISAPSHENERNVIRQTWASKPPPEVSVRFAVGTNGIQDKLLDSLAKESSSHGDLLLLENLQESFQQLTKKVLETMKFVVKNVQFNFLMKVDEDSFVRLEEVSYELLSKPQERLYWGFFDGRASVKRSGKWEEKEYVLCDRYLPYALGGGYVLSKDLVQYVVTNADLLQIFKNEDASLGTWLAPLNINRIHDPHFDTEYKSRGCFNSYLVTHKKSPADMQQLHTNLKSNGHLCSAEHQERLSYIYNWNAPPSKCCERNDIKVP